MSFSEMVAMLLAWIQHTGNTTMQTRCKDWLNAVYREWMTEARVETDAGRVQLSNTVDSPYMVMPVDFLSMVQMRIMSRTAPGATDTTYRRVLEEWTPRMMDSHTPNRDTDTNATPRRFIIRATGGMAPGANSAVGVISDSASDTTPTASVVGYTAAARTALIHKTVTLTGTTEAALGATFTEVISFSKSANTTGSITLRDSADAALLVLQPWERTAIRHYIELVPCPATSEVYLCELLYHRRFPRMVNDADVPFGIPEEYHMGFVAGAVVYAAAFVDDTRTQEAMALHDRAKKQFLATRRSSEVSDGRLILASSGLAVPRIRVPSNLDD